MRWFWQPRGDRYLFGYGGFNTGDVVRHKITGERAVIVCFERDPEDGTVEPIVSIGWYSTQEFQTTCAEIEHVPVSQPADGTPEADTAVAEGRKGTVNPTAREKNSS